MARSATLSNSSGVAIVGQVGNADAGADIVAARRGVYWLAQADQKLVRERFHCAPALRRRQQQHKFVAAQSGHGVHRAGAGVQSACHFLQQPVASFMAAAVVDWRSGPDQSAVVPLAMAVAGLVERLIQCFGQAATVGQAGQRSRSASSVSRASLMRRRALVSASSRVRSITRVSSNCPIGARR